MNKSILYILFLGIIGFLSSCVTSDPAPTNVLTQETIDKITAYGKTKNLTFTRSADDIFYAITVKNDTGRTPKSFEYIKLYYTYTKLDGTIIDSSATNQKIPVAFPYAVYNSILNYTTSLMKQGESISVVFPSTSISDEPLVVNAKLISTRNETEQINEYIAEKYKGLTFKKTASGLQYLITKASAMGDSAKINKTATVNYIGKLFNKNLTRNSEGFPVYTDIFDGGSFSFVAGSGSTVSGFDEATRLMKVGDKGTFIFPSALGYKERGASVNSQQPVNNSTKLYNLSILPYTPLLFEIEVTAVK
jgi:FKBP-type peptidyl-prolyl cis-trans isomerase